MRKTLVSLIVLGAGLSVAAAGLAQAQDTTTTTAAPMAQDQGGPGGFGGRGPGGPGGGPDGRGGGGPDGRGGPGGPGGPDGRGPGGPGGPDGGRGPGGPGGPDGRGPGGPPDAPMALPTSGNGLALLNLIRQVCDPLAAPKAKLDNVAKNVAGFEKVKANKTDLPFGGWKGPFGSGGSATFVGQSEANQQVCEVVLDTQKDDAQVLADAITPWSNLHKPFMALRRNDAVSAGAANLRRFTWIGFDEAQTYALNMNVETNPDGSSPYAGGDRIRVRYSISKR